MSGIMIVEDVEELQDFSIPSIEMDSDEYHYQALNIYSFLRSMSLVLQLSPFEAETFIKALESSTCSNPLMDEIHFALIRNCGAEATKYFTAWYVVDWTLLDRVTWPTFLLPLFQTWLEKADALTHDKIDHAIKRELPTQFFPHELNFTHIEYKPNKFGFDTVVKHYKGNESDV